MQYLEKLEGKAARKGCRRLSDIINIMADPPRQKPSVFQLKFITKRSLDETNRSKVYIFGIFC